MGRILTSLAAIALAACLSAESARVRLSTSVRKGSFLVILDSPAGSAPSGLQFDVAAPPAVTVTLSGLQLGSAAASAGKNLHCAARESRTPGARFTCIVGGGQKPIPNGPFMVVYYLAHGNAGGAPVRVGIEKALAVAPNGESIPAADTQAILEAR